MLSSKKKAILAARAALDRKAHDLVVLEVRKISSLADYFLICSGRTSRQTHAIAEAVDEAFSKNHVRGGHVEGAAEGRWILMDYGDVVVHVFDDPTRAYYDLERLWGDAPRVPVDEGRGE